MSRRLPSLAAFATLLLAAAARAAEPEAPGAAAALPADPGEEIVVTATRGPRARRDVPAAVNVVTREEIERSPSKTADELLRTDPNFGLFRRSSSLGADPSSQGMKLRNVGGTAISRALVLVDGIPVNDPFGGWVAWRAIPRLGLQRIEVVPGGGSALYGNYALGGVVQAFSRPIEPFDVDMVLEGGSFGTAQVAARAADRRGPVGVALEGDLLSSEGYHVVAPSSSGAIDRNTPSTHANLQARVELEASPDLRFDLRGGLFHEAFNGGTRYTTAMMRRFDYAGGAHWTPAGVGNVDLALFGHHGEFRQDRARIIGARLDEALNAHQIVPTDGLGAGLVWRGRPLSLGGTHALSAGGDARWIRGSTLESFFPPPTPATALVERNARGQQRLYGLFAQDLYDVTPAVGLSLALRYDRWENRAGTRLDRALNGSETPVAFPDRSGGELSPKAGVRVRIVEWLSARAAAYRSFRAPTMDELYRPFQVGTLRTASNESLTPERLRGFEAGLDLGRARGLSAHLTGFWNEMQDPILTVTLQAGDLSINKPGGPYQRERRNLGKARIQGFQADAGWSWRQFAVAAAWTLADTQVTSAPGQPALVGKALPQSPKHQGTLSVSYDDPRLATASAQLRYVGKQYENDVNTLPMGEVLLVDLFASWPATDRLELYAAVENLLDKSYLVGRAGVDTVGQPRFVHGGIRARLGR